MKKKLPWFEIVLSIAFLSANIYAAFSDAYNLPNRWFIRDDAYYYFKVAQNISEGRGSTFDGIHPTNGYHPLWMLICIPIFALARFDLILPLRVLVILSGLLQLATGILLYRLVKSALSPPAGVIAAFYWLFDSYILVFLYKTGVESIIALFFITLLLYLLLKFEKSWRSAPTSIRQIAVFGILGALITFSRLDLIFFALILGIWIVFRDASLRYFLPLDMLAIFVSTLAAFIVRLGFTGFYDAGNSVLIMVIAGLLINIPVFYALGLYTRPSGWKPPGFLLRLLVSVVIGSALVAVVLLAASALHLIPPISRAILLMDAGFTLGFVLLIRVAAFIFSNREKARQIISPLEEIKAHWTTWLKEAAVYYGIVGGALSLYMIWNKLVFGTFSPISGQVKRWWGSFAVSVYGGPAKTWLSFFTLDAYGEYNAWQPTSLSVRNWSNALLYKDGSKFGNPAWQHNFIWVLIISFIAVFLILLIRRKKSIRAVVQAGMIPLFVGSWFQALSYNVTGYASPKEWYWLTEPILLTILAVLLIDVVFELLFKRWLATRVLMWALVAWFGIRTGYSYWTDAYALNPYGRRPPSAAYEAIPTFLLQTTQPGDIIGMTGGGNVAYFIPQRTIVNMDGLINSSEYFQAMQAGTGSDYLYNTGMRYVFVNPNLLEANPYRGQYNGRLQKVVDWGGKDLLRLLPKPSK